MNALNTALLAATSLLAATLSTAALAADKAEPGASASKVASADTTREKTHAEFIRARKAGELDYGHAFEIAETVAFKRARPDATPPSAVQLAAH